MVKSVYSSTFRNYRRPSAHSDEVSFQVVLGESDLWITVLASSGAEKMACLALETLGVVRSQLQAWIALRPEFAASLTPLPPGAAEGAPEIAVKMLRASAGMGVGPMAAVAGAVAGAVAESLARESAECLVENGGDTMLYSTRERTVALLVDPRRGAGLGLRLSPEDFPVSLCASSAFIGNSLSLGQGDLAVVRSRDPCLADAGATAFCNMLQKAGDCARAVERARRGFRRAKGQEAGVDGIFVQCCHNMAVWGNMELAALDG